MNAIIIESWKIVIGYITLLAIIYWKFVYYGPNGTFNYSSVFLNKYLLSENSKYNKLYPTKKNNFSHPRILQTTTMLMVTIITLVLITAITLIMTILRQDSIIKVMYNFIFIIAVSSLLTNFIILIIKIIQMFICSKKEKTMEAQEINDLMNEISKKHAEFYN